ncbi:MAG TPA: CHAT domain-containing protein [Roseiflexaceae bacterium]|nr:CHAT domain-containing protein [Roseiflexaceae bacterium]
MQYEDMIIEATQARVETKDGSRVGSFRVRVIESPEGALSDEQAVTVSYDHKALEVEIGKLDRRSLDRAHLIQLGRTLGALLLPDQPQPRSIYDLFVGSLNRIGRDAGLRLRLQLPPVLADLPWEYLYVDRTGDGDSMDGFLALDPRVAIVRQEIMPTPLPPLAVSGPITVVAALASHEDFDALDLEKERADLEQTFAGQGGVSVAYIPNATLDAVLGRLADAHIFHFAGHGAYTRTPGDTPGSYTGQGALAFADQLVDAEQLAANLSAGKLRLAVLGACDSGRRDKFSIWSGVAPALVRSAKTQLPAVVANQFKILDVCAIAFGKHLYQALVAGQSIEYAVTVGRIAAYNADKESPNARDWGVPVLYMRARDGILFTAPADEAVRAQAAEAARQVFAVRAQEVAAGGYVSGLQAGTVRNSNLAVVVETGDVSGDVVGAVVKKLQGGDTRVDVTAGDVKEGGRVIGAQIDEIGG